jgi:hypothetical protein
MMLSGDLLVDLEQIDSVDIVATVVNASGKPFDDRQRGRGLLAKRNGHWPRTTSKAYKREPIPVASVLGFEVDANGKTGLLKEEITLLRIQSLPDPRAVPDEGAGPLKPIEQGRLTPLDLRLLYEAAITGNKLKVPMALLRDAKVPKEKQPTFEISVSRPSLLSDSKARFLSLRAVGLSRFAAAFETAPRFTDDGKEHVLHRRQPLTPEEQSKSSVQYSVWSKSTDRPAMVAAKTPTPYFSTTRKAERNGETARQHFHRSGGIRLRFDRGMFSSGEGERIGIVLWPPNIREHSAVDLDDNRVKVSGRSMQLSKFDDADLGDGGKFITRWGGDPIRSDPEPQKGMFMSWSVFDRFPENERQTLEPHGVQYVPSARMPVIAPRAGDGGNMASASLPVIEEFLDVSLLTFDPYFDINREEWFVDVPIHLARATDPFIRFGLVRYQHKSIRDELKVSAPVRVWSQLPPHRHVSVTYDRPGKADISVQVRVSGPSSDGVSPMPDKLKYLLANPGQNAVWQRLQRSKMTLRLVHEGAPTTFGRHQTDILPNHRPVVMPDVDNNEMVWKLDATIPAARADDLGAGRIVALVEEFEERLAASYPKEPIALESVLTEASIRQSGPRFLARVPFLDV